MTEVTPPVPLFTLAPCVRATSPWLSLSPAKRKRKRLLRRLQCSLSLSPFESHFDLKSPSSFVVVSGLSVVDTEAVGVVVTVVGVSVWVAVASEGVDDVVVNAVDVDVWVAVTSESVEEVVVTVVGVGVWVSVASEGVHIMVTCAEDGVGVDTEESSGHVSSPTPSLHISSTAKTNIGQ